MNVGVPITYVPNPSAADGAAINLGGSPQVLAGTWSNPTGFAVPEDPAQPAIYYQDFNGTHSQWGWSSSLNWFAMVTGIWSGGTTQVYTGAWADPNGHVTPTDQTQAATYYQDNAGTLNSWDWSVASKAWFPVITT